MPWACHALIHQFAVDSSGHFLFTAWTDTQQSQTQQITLPVLRLGYRLAWLLVIITSARLSNKSAQRNHR